MKSYMLAGMIAIALVACSNDGVSGLPDGPETSITETKSSSSDFDLEYSSSSLDESSSSLENILSSTKQEISSSSTFHPLCKVSGDWGSRGGCSEMWPRGDGDLWSNGKLKVNTSLYMEDSVSFGEGAGEFFFRNRFHRWRCIANHLE